MRLHKIVRHPLSIAATVIGLLVAALLVGTPYLIDMVVERWIASHGPQKGLVEDIDFNPFTGKLAMYNLQVETESGRSLEIPFASLRLSWPHLIKKQVYFKDLIVQNTYLIVEKLEGARLRVAGLILQELIGVTEEAGTPKWAMGVGRFQMLNSKVEYRTPELEADYHIDRYLITGLESWNKQKTVKLELQGKINTSPIHIKAEVTPFAPAPVWKGSLKLQNGELSLLSKALALQQLTMDGSTDVNVDVEAVLQEDKVINITAEGSVDIRKLNFQYNDTTLSEDDIRWNGTISAKRQPQQGLSLLAEGEIASNDLDVRISSKDMHLQLAGFTWQGRTQFEQQGESLALTMEADLDGGSTSVIETLHNMKLVHLNNITLRGIAVQSLNEIHISDIVLKKPQILQRQGDETEDKKNPDPALFRAETAEINDIRLQNSKDLIIKAINLNDFQAYLRREKQGGWYMIDTLVKQPGSIPADTGIKEKSSDEPVSFKLDRLQVSGDSSIRFEDESTYRPYRTTLHVKEFQLAKINTTDTGTPAHLRFHGQIGEYTKVMLNSEIKPFEKPLSLDMKGKIEALDMPPLSSYTGPTIGYNLTSGQMDADLSINTSGGEVDGNADLRMRNLEVAKQDPEKVPELDKQIDVPLESALSFLEDENDEIRLNIKLQGNINNPDFDFQDTINQALGKAMKLAAVNYLKYTLQPFGTYIAIAEIAVKAGKEIAKVRLDPVQFTPGTSELDEKAKQYLERVAVVLKNRPKLRIEICGIAVEKDRIAMQERQKEKQEEAAGKVMKLPSEEDMSNLAEERAKHIKNSLVKQHGISHERMYLCLPETVKSSEKQPVVELHIE
jgi:outer membrane protein OmpA-like peptidoglycan-associated protein